MDILPSLRRMEIENDVKTMIFAVAQHLIETRETGLFVFERRGIVLKVPVIERNPDDRSASLPQKDDIVSH